MNFTLEVWRQKGAERVGHWATYPVSDISPDMSFLEVLDLLNEDLLDDPDEPIAFDYDCREGICGSCSVTINGDPHGPAKGTTACQLYMREFEDGETIRVEPFRAGSYPVVRDLVVDRSALDRIVQAGGFITARTGSAPDANAIPIPRASAETSFDAAACIGCGACVDACPNASAMLFTAAKAAHFAHLPQGQAERDRRTLALVEAHDAEGFGSCANHLRCEGACPKEISVRYIAELNRDYFRAALREPESAGRSSATLLSAKEGDA